MNKILEEMTLIDWFATFAPEPNAEIISSEMELDKMKNPYNDSHKPPLRSKLEIIIDYKYKYAKTMLERRKALS